MKTNRTLTIVIFALTFYYTSLTLVKAQAYIQDPSGLQTLISVNSTADLLEIDDTIYVNFDPMEHLYMGINKENLDPNMVGVIIRSFAGRSHYRKGKVYKKNTYQNARDKNNSQKNRTNYNVLPCSLREMVVQVIIYENLKMPPKKRTITIINEGIPIKVDKKKENRNKTLKSIIEVAGVLATLLK